jgi:hypothetical protein
MKRHGQFNEPGPLEAISDDLEAFYAESAHNLVANCGRAALVSGILDHARVATCGVAVSPVSLVNTVVWPRWVNSNRNWCKSWSPRTWPREDWISRPPAC